MKQLNVGEAVLLRLPDGRVITGHVSQTYDFVTDDLDPDLFTD